MRPKPNEELARAVASEHFQRFPFDTYRDMVDAVPWVAPSGKLVLSKYETLRTVLVDHERFGQHLAPWPNFHRLNPPEHTRMRRLVSKAFTPKSIRSLQPEIERVSRELIDDAGDSFDLISDYAFHLPARIVSDMIGVPADDVTLWHGWLVRMGRFNFLNPFVAQSPDGLAELIEDAQDANREQAEYFDHVIQERLEARSDDIVSRLIDARDEDDQLTDEEVRYVLVLLLQGGLHTTVHQIGNMMRVVLETPGLRDLIRDDDELVPAAVDEALRLVGPLQTEVRVARTDTVVEGVDVAVGDELVVVNAAANRDPRVFANPDVFDLRRPNVGAHLGFGLGVHHCIGAPLAKAELHVALRHLVAVPNLSLASTPSPDPFFRIRGHERIPVTTSTK